MLMQELARFNGPRADCPMEYTVGRSIDAPEELGRSKDARGSIRRWSKHDETFSDRSRGLPPLYGLA